MIRPAVPEDSPAIADLWLACTAEVAVHESIYQPGLSRTALTELRHAELSCGRILAWVAETGGRLAAYATCRLEHGQALFAPRRYLHVIDLDVAPAFRRRGLSRRLLACVEQFARQQAVTRIELAYAHGDPRSSAVWARHGFRPHLVVAHKKLP